MAYTNIDKPSDYFNTVLYSGTGSSNSVSGVGFQPDFTWIKSRNNTRNHNVYDSVRGTTKVIYADLTDAESTQASGLTSFNSDGFTVVSDLGVNGVSDNYASWNWLAGGTGVSNTQGSIASTVSANTTSGFSIVSYTGTGSVATVGHGLGAKPSIVIYKQRNTTNSWRVMHDIGGTLKRIYLNATDAEASIIDSSTAPTSTVLNIGTGSEVNTSGGTYIAYCFAEKKGFSKAFSYTGNGSSDGSFTYLGFRPAFVLVKQSSASGEEWQLVDNKRNTYNPSNTALFPSSSVAENSGNDRFDFLSNGFKCRSTSAGVNSSGATYVGIAFAESPFTTSTGIPATAR